MSRQRRVEDDHLRVSVIIPTINEAENIASCISSCWDSNADEVIVADGGSSDSTLEVARSLNCRVVISMAGRGVQQNQGARVASGDYLLFLHADCRLAPSCIAQVREAATCNRRPYGGFRQRIDKTRKIFRWLERGNELRASRLGLIYGDQAIFVSRPVFEQLGGFPAEPLMEDVVLSRRLTKFGPPLLLPGPVQVGTRRWERHGVVRQTARNWLLLSAFFLGVSPQRLAKAYRRHDRPLRPQAAASAGSDSPPAETSDSTA